MPKSMYQIYNVLCLSFYTTSENAQKLPNMEGVGCKNNQLPTENPIAVKKKLFSRAYEGYKGSMFCTFDPISS